MSETYCGFVAIVGQPNVGKSTLLNYLLGEKVSITSRKPQTTRHRILGIKTELDTQIIFVDTPGMHLGEKKALNRYLNREARSAWKGVDVILFMITAKQWNEQDQWIADQLKSLDCPVILVINKIDQLSDKAQLLPQLERFSKEHIFKAMIPISAKKGDQIQELVQFIRQYLPQAPFYFPADQVTDRDSQFRTTEIIREKLMRLLGQELPYVLTVTLDQFIQEETIFKIAATIWVEKQSQKAIVIGKDGSGLKRIGTEARQDLEQLFQQKVYLQLWVKVSDNWSDTEKSLTDFGYKV